MAEEYPILPRTPLTDPVARQEALKQLQKLQGEDSPLEIDVDKEADKLRAVRERWSDNLAKVRPPTGDTAPMILKDAGNADAPGTRDDPEIDDKERTSRAWHANDETGAAKGGK